MTITGRCLCGAVRYAVNGPLIGADHCHCSKCRRAHGAAFATYADFKRGDFAWAAGQALVKVYEAPSGAGWCFCRKCGSTLAGSENGEVTSITLGTVEGDPGIRPTCHIFVGSKAPWYEPDDGLPQYERRASDEPTPPARTS